MAFQSPYLSGYIFRPFSRPGVYDRVAARAVSNINPVFNTQLLERKG